MEKSTTFCTFYEKIMSDVNRVRTEFRIQDFFQNNNLFFQTHGYHIGDQQRPSKTQEPSFSHDALQS